MSLTQYHGMQRPDPLLKVHPLDKEELSKLNEQLRRRTERLKAIGDYISPGDWADLLKAHPDANEWFDREGNPT